MSRSVFAMVSFCLALGACGPTHEWVKPEMTPATRESDIMSCGNKASHLVTDDVAATSIIDRCMADRGYRKVAK